MGRQKQETKADRVREETVREIEVTVTLRTADGGWTTHTTTLAVLEEQDPILMAGNAAATAARSAQMKPIEYLPKGVR